VTPYLMLAVNHVTQGGLSSGSDSIWCSVCCTKLLDFCLGWILFLLLRLVIPIICSWAMTWTHLGFHMCVKTCLYIKLYTYATTLWEVGTEGMTLWIKSKKILETIPLAMKVLDLCIRCCTSSIVGKFFVFSCVKIW